MTIFMCNACGTQHDETTDPQLPPERCLICSDDRQHVAWEGQAWTTHEELLSRFDARVERDGDLLGVGIAGSFAIPQRALLVPTGAGSVLWDCTSLVTEQAVERLMSEGGVDAIAISHPHFYSSMVEWSDALGGVPILLHEADRQWVQRHSPNVEFWSGAERVLSSTVRLIHTPGHFPGSTVLHWTAAPNGRTALLAGDSLHVAGDRRHVAFVHSVPNHVPMHPDLVRGIRTRLDGVGFDDLYGFTWGLNIIGDARAAVDDSFDRFLHAVGQ